MDCPESTLHETCREELSSEAFQHRSYVLGRPEMDRNGATENGGCSSGQWGAAAGGIGRADVSQGKACGCRAPFKGQPMAGRRSKRRKMRGLQWAKNAQNWRIWAGCTAPSGQKHIWRLHSRERDGLRGRSETDPRAQAFVSLKWRPLYEE